MSTPTVDLIMTIFTLFKVSLQAPPRTTDYCKTWVKPGTKLNQMYIISSIPSLFYIVSTNIWKITFFVYLFN